MFSRKKIQVLGGLILVLQLFVFTSAQRRSSNPEWLTLDGSPPLVIARGGFSGLFPDSSATAYQFAVGVSVPDLVVWCDVQLSRDGIGICFPNIKLDNSSAIQNVFPNASNSYDVNGVPTNGYFSIDFTFEELSTVPLTQGIYTRSPAFDGAFPIQSVEEVFIQSEPAGFWLNVQHDEFYSQHNLSMRSFILNASQNISISHISSPEVNFLRGLGRPLASTRTKLVLRFLDEDAIEPSTNQTYGSLLTNLSMITTFASGILVPKAYIWPLDATSYLLPHTSLVEDAHRVGLEVFAADFANDVSIAYNYSYNPVAEYGFFIDNGDFSVDGVLSDFPITPSEARDCFAHLGSNASAQAKPLVISHDGASGDFPGCTDEAYAHAIRDGADVIDCPVQMSNDGVPFCLSSVNLLNNTLATQFRTLMSTVDEIQPAPGLFTFSLSWTDIQGLTPVISSPYSDSLLLRNPKFRTAGRIVSLADFLNLAKNSSSLSGVLIKIENAQYLAVNQGMSITDAVSDALDEAGYNSSTATKVMIQSTSSSVLKAMRRDNYELVYEVDETISGALNDTIADIQTFADSVVVDRMSVLPFKAGFLQNMTDVVSQFQAFNLSVYVQVLMNEFSSIPFDAFSDPIVQINTFVNAANVDGVITDFPKTAAAYKRNLCLKMDETPAYMMPAQPGALMSLVGPAPGPTAGPAPAAAPTPLLTVEDVAEPPLPAVVPSSASSPPEATPTSRPTNGQQQVAVSGLLSLLALIVAAALLF
ncbi:glycerophosphodiester phosphodiesterase GDPDL3 [Spinacia oleracea]|uniref:glycerophosphodiester phosphodiesterase n=1 Tax=Spinacia oleracea TaxID=3562 RepID=A0ABM3RNT1_SPIOL|nr:glycerophosphodiester phosphodiesterase GDPDL3-like [Spinacia oleracea]XP_056697276.1 glycerophosphodiester phosphodiesterase GDPDL3-like [Spinacia oleracea]